jgi:hypothetical protein
VIAWLIGSQRMTPLELVVLVALEAVLLILIAWLQSRLVPAAARETNPMRWRQRLGTLAFGMVWLGFVYGLMLLVMIPSGAEAARLLHDPIAFVGGSNLKWPLLITLAGAVVDAPQDSAHFRRAGGTFLSTPGLHGAARLLTLFLGAIPFFVPLVAVLVAAKTVIENAAKWLGQRAPTGAGNARTITLLVSMLTLCFFASVAWLIRSEVSAWAIGYCCAKFVSELFVVCLPLIANTAHAQESQALATQRAKS